MNKDICLQYFKRYPLSEIQDFIKFLFQSVMGSGHLISDPIKNYQMFLDEYNCIEYDENHILFEEISDDLLRLHLEPLKRESLEEIHKLVMLSTFSNHSKEELLTVFKEVELGIEEGWIPYDLNEWKKEVKEYIDKGCSVISHSSTFRIHYHPHYRLIKKEYKKRISTILD